MWMQYKQYGWWSDSFWGYPGGGYLFGERMYQGALRAATCAP